MVTVAAMSLALVACGGSTKSADETTPEAPATEAAAPASEEKSVLAKYEEFVEKAIPLLEKMKKGDVEATQEYAKITEELGKFIQDNQEEFTKFSEDDAKKYQELSQKLVDAAK